MTLSPDGTARVTVAGPDDRPIDTDAEWTREGDELVVRAKGERGGGDQLLRVSIEGPTRLLVQDHPERPEESRLIAARLGMATFVITAPEA